MGSDRMRYRAPYDAKNSDLYIQLIIYLGKVKVWKVPQVQIYLCRACQFRLRLSHKQPVWIYERERTDITIDGWWHTLTSGSVKHLSIDSCILVSELYSLFFWGWSAFEILSVTSGAQISWGTNFLGVFAIHQPDTDFTRKIGKVWTNNARGVISREVAKQNYM